MTSIEIAAWGAIGVALMGSLTTGIVSIIVALKQNKQLTVVAEAMPVVAEAMPILPIIHEAVNTNYQAMEKKLDKALDDLRAANELQVNRLIAENERLVAKLNGGLNGGLT